MNNILEWQERNIEFWEDRYYLVIIFLLVLVIWCIALIFKLSNTILVVFSIFLLCLIEYNVLKHYIEKTCLTKAIDLFMLSLSTEKILDYKLAVCRDYAKLTVALLLNLYSRNKIYFIIIPHHVSPVIELNSKIYILDQKLPIHNIDAWLKINNTKTAELIRIKNEKNNVKMSKPIKITLNKNLEDVSIEKIP